MQNMLGKTNQKEAGTVILLSNVKLKLYGPNRFIHN